MSEDQKPYNIQILDEGTDNIAICRGGTLAPKPNDSYYEFLGVRYEGRQCRTKGAYSLDLFTDLQTGSSFLRLPFESLEQARDRIRKNYKKEGK